MEGNMSDDIDSDDNSTTMTQDEVESSVSVVPEVEVTTGDDKVTTAGDDHDDVDDDDDDDDVKKHDVVKDVIMWRRRKMSAVVLLGATAVWVLFRVYHFKFTPLVSWMAMASATLLFLYGAFLRLLSKEVPNVGMVEWELTEERAKEMANTTKRVMEKGIRWMFRVSCEREWYEFVGVVTALLLLAYLGHHFDLLTLLYTGTLVGMTVPGIYVKKEDKIKAYGERVRNQGRSLYNKLDDKVLSRSKLKHKDDDCKKNHKIE